MESHRWNAVILAGGRGQRLGGADKSTLVIDGNTLLDRILGAVSAADQIVVVADPTNPIAGVTFVREEPPYAGPVAALYAGLDAFTQPCDVVVVLAVDLPGVTTSTVTSLLAAMAGDGAVLVDADRRRQLAIAVRVEALAAGRPEVCADRALQPLLATLDLAEVVARDREADDIDTAEDLASWRELRGEGLLDTVGFGDAGRVNLHDWIDELCDALDIDTEVDEGLLLDLARSAAQNVERVAAPISTYLVGYAAGLAEATPEEIESLVAKAQALAAAWDRPADAPDEDDVDDEIPDDSAVDHAGDEYEE